MKPLLLLSTLHRNHAAHSGYQELAANLPEAQFLHTIRADPPGGLRKFAAQVARQFSFSRWYLGGCVALETEAWKEIRAGFTGIIHSMWSDHDLGYLDLTLSRKRHRLVGSFHNCDDTFAHTIRFPKRLRKFDAIILMSASQEAFFLEAGVPGERIHVVPHGVDTDYFRPPTPGIAREAVFTVLAAGGYRRNFPLLREVCTRLKDRTDLRFDIVGPVAMGEMFADLPIVRFRSGISDGDFLQAYQSCDCLIQTVENATANNVILEAMSCGKPVVAERIGGIPEYVDADCAILTPPGDGGTLAEAILELRSAPDKKRAMGIAARAKAESMDWRVIASRMRAIYETL